MLTEMLVATYQAIQERRARAKGPPQPFDVVLPLDPVQRVYALHAWTTDDPLKNLEPNERVAILTVAPTWGERVRIMRLRSDPQRQRSAMVEIMCERRLQYDLAQSALLRGPTKQPAALPKKPALTPYYQHRMNLHKDTVYTMLSTRRIESERQLAQSPEAKEYKQRLDAVREHIAQLQKILAIPKSHGPRPVEIDADDEDDLEPRV